MSNSKTQNALLGIGLTVAFLAVLMILSWPKAKDASSASANLPVGEVGALALAETSFDFGRISMAAGPVTHDFIVRNRGTSPVTITKLYTSCMCTQAKLVAGNQSAGPFGMPGHSGIPGINVTLAPGETGVVTAIFDPAAHGPAGVGAIDRVVYVENNSGKNVELGFKAFVTP